MADPNEKGAGIEVMESQDGSATVDLPDNLVKLVEDGEENGDLQSKGDSNRAQDDDVDHPDDNEELRAAKRNRRRAKKDLIRKTNQEKDVRLQQLQRENEEFKRRLGQLERNTKAEQITRLDKNIEDTQVRLEYAKMKLSEATQNNDGAAMVEAQTLWRDAETAMGEFSRAKHAAEQALRQPPQNFNVPDPVVQRNAADWIKRNSWYRPDAADQDSKVAKKVDELMITQGWNPADPDYWDELDARLQKELPHRYNDPNDDDSRHVRRPRNVVGSSGREASAAYGGSNRTQFVLSPDRVKAMKDAGAWDNPERKARMIKNFIEFDRQNGRRN